MVFINLGVVISTALVLIDVIAFQRTPNSAIYTGAKRTWTDARPPGSVCEPEHVPVHREVLPCRVGHFDLTGARGGPQQQYWSPIEKTRC